MMSAEILIATSKLLTTTFILNKCKESNIEQAIKLLTDLFIKILNGDGKLDVVTKVFPEFLKLYQSDPSTESMLLDALWLLDCAVTDTTSDAVRDRYFDLLRICKPHLNTALLLERLSEDTLENVSLIQSKQQFQTRYVRTKTRLFFKQHKFNLLREENEGYAKLITEMCQFNTNSVDSLMTRIKALIGYFDLDPNRVLDLILDASELRYEVSSLLIRLIRLYNPDKIDLSHLLGHKFHFYQEPDSSTPHSLYRLAALLVCEGLVNFDTLYGHLLPTDESIANACSRRLTACKHYRPITRASLARLYSSAVNGSLNDADYPSSQPPPSFDRPSSGNNLVLSSGSLWANESSRSTASDDHRNSHQHSQSDDLQDASSHLCPAEFAEDDLANEMEDDASGSIQCLYENNQKLGFCTAFIQLGEWTSAQTILDRFDGYWPTKYKPLCSAMCDLLHRLIEPLYAKTCPLPPIMQRTRKRPVLLSRCGLYSVSSDEDEEDSQDDKHRSEATTESVSSINNESLLQPVTDFTQLARTVIPIASYLGSNANADPLLMVKLCRIGAACLTSRDSASPTIDSLYQAFFNLLDEVLLPSLTLSNSNCALSEEIWSLLKLFPYDHRYRLYGQWKHISPRNEPSIIRRHAQVVVQARAALKQLTKENIKPMGRMLSKLAHTNPGLLFDQVLQTLQMFSNLITPVIEALKYINDMALDVLVFCIIEALSVDDSKLEDWQFSQSLTALSSFTGHLCKKYHFELSGLLQYVLNKLKIGKSYDLLMLREILHRMSGIDNSDEMTDEQLESMTGGEILLQEGGYYAQIRNTRKNANRLKKALIEHKLIMPFIILMAQQRDLLVFVDEPDRNVKLTGRLYDQCQGTLVQFITFIGLQLSRDELNAHCLPIDQMMSEFHLPTDTAFCLYRSLFEQRVARLFEIKEHAIGKNEERCRSTSKALFASVAQQVCAQVASDIRPLHSPRVWDELGANFFVTFWTLQSSDLAVPEMAYQRQIHAIRVQIQQAEALASSNGWTKTKREVSRLQAIIDRLSAEQLERHEHVARVRAWLTTERDNWFQTRQVTKTDMITQFLQLCIYPRVCFTAADALYAAKFMHVLHQLKTSRFSTLICLDRIFNDITLPTSMCTEDEAHRYGRFLCAVLEHVMRWHSSEETFKQECGQFPGFVTVFRKGSDPNTKADPLEYENYRHVVHKWHYRITKAAIACLESGIFVQIRNALIVLTRILPQYPRVMQFGSAVERRVVKLRDEEKDKRPDLMALAFSYLGLLRPTKSKWISDDRFHAKELKQPLRTIDPPPPLRPLSNRSEVVETPVRRQPMTAPTAPPPSSSKQQSTTQSIQGSSSSSDRSRSSKPSTSSNSSADPSNRTPSNQTTITHASTAPVNGTVASTSVPRNQVRSEPANFGGQSSEAIGQDSSHGSKRKRVDGNLTSSSPSNADTQPVGVKALTHSDEAKLVRKLARKRSSPPPKLPRHYQQSPPSPPQPSHDSQSSSGERRRLLVRAPPSPDSGEPSTVTVKVKKARRTHRHHRRSSHDSSSTGTADSDQVTVRVSRT